MTLRCYVARTRRAWDKLAQRELKAQGFEPWIQILKITEVLRGVFVEGERPVFPFYQFVWFDVDDRQGPRWQAIYSTPNVSHLLPKPMRGREPMPVPVPEALVEGLKGAGTIDEVARVIATYVTDETKFWIRMGPFADFIGTYKETFHGELKLETDVFGRRTLISVPAHWAEKI